ncbi:hypothetical protein [Ruminococcus sp.]|uniref:hypothetical protein n=1 Tax=Ruminococcus sp. TaxID=41978 RepID=UPI0025EF7B5B|nr:hypothetical protein [Ruminococcus sp.]
MEKFDVNDKKEDALEESQVTSIPEPIHITGEVKQKKEQHADDVALTQCILCVILVLCVFALHWLKPEWQEMLLTQYAIHRDAPPVAWLDHFLKAVQQWIAG